MFLAWMEANKIYPEAKDLLYAEFPKFFVWKSKDKKWMPRKRGFSIGRLAHVHPTAEEYYYLRVLLNHVRGPTSYEDLRTYRDIVYPTFFKAVEARGLLDDDKEYILAIKDCSQWMLGNALLRFFAILLAGGCITKPEDVWKETWEYLTEDVLYRTRLSRNSPDLNLTVEEIKRIALSEIEEILQSIGCSLEKWTEMPKPDDFSSYVGNRLIDDERSYNIDGERNENARLLGMITDEQRRVYEEVLDAVMGQKGGVFFLYGFGGTGKTFVWNILSSAIRSQGKIVLNTASSGIASLLLPGGRTAHSRFAIPLNADESTSCNIKHGSDIAELLVKADLIIWDEAPMMSRHCFESLDRTLKDLIRTEEERPFGGKVIVFGGDFRQILPVMPGGGRSETVLASLNSSYLWEHCKILKLTKNMRLLAGLNEEEAEKQKEFSKWILDIGDGKINEPNDGVVEIDIPKDLLISGTGDPIETIVEEVYGRSFVRCNDSKFYQDRAILSPTNEVVDRINDYMLQKFEGNF